MATLISGMLAASTDHSQTTGYSIIAQPLLDVQQYHKQTQVVEVLQASCMYPACKPGDVQARLLNLERLDIWIFKSRAAPLIVK